MEKLLPVLNHKEKLPKSISLLSPLEYQSSALELAPRLLGCLLIKEENQGLITGGRIVETEAYHQDDEASHSYRGRTAANQAMFAEGGQSYVYRSYGVHWCFNIVSGQKGIGEAVLIRSLEPLFGIELMQVRRKFDRITKPCFLTNGPGKLCQALSITMVHNEHNLLNPPIQIYRDLSWKEIQIVRSERIGISRAKDKLWRFFLANHPCVSGRRLQNLSSSSL